VTANGSGMNADRLILVVEDDQDVRDTLLEIFEYEGHPAIGVPDGQAALEWLRDAPVRPALILLDLMMPGMNGQEFREEQLKDPALASIPTFILSADTTAHDKEVSLQATEFLLKPVKLDALLDVAQRYTAN
jgi:CheY-like chemotaxis protein